jgi:hypothetical protein
MPFQAQNTRIDSGKFCRVRQSLPGYGTRPPLSRYPQNFHGEQNMNDAFKTGSGACSYPLATSPIRPGKANEMIATGSREMKEDYYKGLALTALLYGILLLTSVLMTQF